MSSQESKFSRRSVAGALLVGIASLRAGRAGAATKKKVTTTRKKKAVATTKPAGGRAVADGSELVIKYTYVVDEGGGGRIHNPYVAVWIENSAGESVRTIQLEYQQGRKGQKWLDDLRRWFRGDQARVEKGGAELVDTISSATRDPGTYSVAWDGKSDTGKALTAGEYYVCVESARERGPYELVREALALNGGAVTKKFADSGSLQGVSVELRSKA